MKTYGIAYCVRQTNDGTFQLGFGYSYSDGERGFIRRPRTWFFDWPVVDAHMFNKFGASQVQGLLGGVEDSWQRARSDAVERAIGDTLAVSMCEILDSREKNDMPCTIYILGPAFNKAVGRLASLRPPEDVTICWICPVPFPSWILPNANEPVLLPSYDPHSDTLWEEEPLVATSEEVDDNVTPSIIQVLRLWSPDKSPSLPVADKVKLWNALLPKEIVVAAGHVDVSSLYSGLPSLAQLQQLSGEDFVNHQSLYTEAAPGNDPLPGWPVIWST